jgi:hypothetical protein
VQVAPGHVLCDQPQLAGCSLCTLAAVNHCHNCRARLCSDHVRMTLKYGSGCEGNQRVEMCPKCGDEQTSSNMMLRFVAGGVVGVVLIVMAVIAAHH